MRNNHTIIMRRVYYSYAASIAEQPMLYVGLGLGGALALFGRVTHVASIFENLLATPVGNVPVFVFNAFANAIGQGEIGTVAVTAALFALSVFAWRHLSRVEFASRLQVA